MQAQRHSIRIFSAAFVLAAIVVTSPLATFQAQARSSTKSFTCSGAKRFVRQHGAVVMNHKASHLYQRFVAHSGFCDNDQSAQFFTVPTKSGSCQLKICKTRLKLFDFDY